MGFWGLAIIASAVVIVASAVVIVAIVAWEIRRKVLERRPEVTSDNEFTAPLRPISPSAHPKWRVCEEDIPSGRPIRDDVLRQRPPNIGGEGHPPYRGPNYLSPEETADYLRPIPHYGRMNLEDIEKGDLAWEFEAGRVAPDGTIWLSPTSRCAWGVCTVPDIEVPKAVRYGWELVPDSRQNGYCEVRRVQP